MSQAGQVPVRESVGAALRFVRENIQFIATIGLIGALISLVLGALQLAVPQTALIGTLASALVQAFIYAALLIAVLAGPEAVRARVAQDGGRVFAAMAIIGFLLFIVFFVITIPITIILVAGPLSAYAPELQNAGGDEAAVLAVMTRFVQEQPLAILVTFLFYAVVWMALTSRLYLAAPASVEAQRVLTFETWAWTKGQTLRIIGARLMLLLPAYVLVTAISFVLGRLVGVDPFAPETTMALAQANPVLFLAYLLVMSFITFTLYTALEAGLSAYLYRGLRPAPAPDA